MRTATSFATGAATVTAFALLAAALLLAGCDIPGLEDAVEEPGTEFRDCAECPAMVAVPAGSYTMGSPAAEAGRHADEGQRRVTIEEPFAVGVYEVTFAEWDACAAAGGCRHRPGHGGWGRGRQPVIDVSWDDAQEYVAWLSSKTGRDYRLPTEAEWEYVARAGTATPFHTGATISTAQANYDGLSAPYGLGRQGTIPRPADRGRLALPQRVRAVRRARQRGGAGRGLLRRLGGRLHQAPRPRRLVGIPPGARAFGLSKLVRSDPPQPPQRLPGRPNALPVNDQDLLSAFHMHHIGTQPLLFQTGYLTITGDEQRRCAGSRYCMISSGCSTKSPDRAMAARAANASPNTGSRYFQGRSQGARGWSRVRATLLMAEPTPAGSARGRPEPVACGDRG